jgi:hypothetical protein
MRLIHGMSAEQYVEGLSAQQRERLSNLVETVWITKATGAGKNRRDLLTLWLEALREAKPRKVNNDAGLHLVKR